MSKLYQKIAQSMPPLSHLQCMECGHTRDIGSVATRLHIGWPKHCGQTMRLFTIRELEAKQ